MSAKTIKRRKYEILHTRYLRELLLCSFGNLDVSAVGDERAYRFLFEDIPIQCHGGYFTTILNVPYATANATIT